MKKINLILVFLMLCGAFEGISQTNPPTDFFAGKWEIMIVGTPSGDVKFLTELVRKDGKLTGQLVDPVDASKPKRPITKVEEKGDNLVIYFESEQAGELGIDLTKVDDDNLKGKVFSFEATAKRIK